MNRPLQRELFDELIVDNFAGGGWASVAMELATGRPVDIAINHDPEAICMHMANHPYTKHLCQDVFSVDPLQVTNGKKVGLAWFSPDCKHFSKAKGGRPVEKKIRDLAWVVVRWAEKVHPLVMIIENVEEFKTWGPLVGDNPCPRRKGKTFYRWKQRLKSLGYRVESKELVACEYGAPTIRKRLFIVARRDGLPIVWPEPTHGPGLIPFRTAAECIDWSIPCPSIFDRKRPLAENTMRRIARGIQKFVIESADPFIVPIAHYNGRDTVHDIAEPLRTITAYPRGGSFSLVVPHITKFRNGSVGSPIDEPIHTLTAGGNPSRPSTGNTMGLVATHLQRHFGQGIGREVTGPAPTITAGGMGKTSLVAAFLAKHYGGNYSGPGSALQDPAGTVTTKDHNALVAANLVRHFGRSDGEALADPSNTITAKLKDSLVTSHLVKLRGTCRHGQDVRQPLPTVTASGTHIGEVRAFLLKYYSTNIGHDCREPLQTVTTKHRFGLVTVHGQEYQIVDIGMRMLSPRELFRAQGFDDSYIIDPIFNGKPMTKTAQVRMCGNSVSPYPAVALINANYTQMQAVHVAA